MPDSSTDSTSLRITSKVAKQYVLLVLVLGFGLIAVCTVLDHLRPIDFGSTGRLGSRVWLYDSSGTWNDYGGDNQIVTSNDAGTKVFDLPFKEVCKSHERLWSPVVSGPWLAYVVEDQQAPRQIKVLNLETSEEIALGHDELGQGEPDISGSWVVFSERSPSDNKGSSIYAYDLSTSTRVPVAVEDGKVRCCPKVSKQWVIYLQWQVPRDSRSESIELRAHSLATGEDFAIGPLPAPNDSSFGTLHALDGDKVAWIRNEPNYARSAHLFDLTTREDRVLPSETGYLGDISITNKHQLAVVSNNGWKVIDWSQPQPTVLRPWGDNPDSLRAAGDYLVGKTSRDVFVVPILP